MLLNQFDSDSLPSLPFHQRSNFPGVACVYFVLNDDNDVLYIGKAVNLAERWRSHHRCNQLKALNASRVAWFACPFEFALPELERSIILHFKPLLNGTEVPEEFKIKGEVFDASQSEDLIPHSVFSDSGWIFSSDGYVDATDICQRNQKRIHSYLSLQSTRQYLEICTQKTGISKDDLVRIGGNGAGDRTWVHLLVALNLARWAQDKGMIDIGLKWIDFARSEGLSILPA